MKKLLFILLSLLLSLNSLAGGVKAGPWVAEARTDRVTILWTSDVPGMAYVELADGTKVWETFAGRRVFHRLHSVRIDGLQPGSILRYRVCGQELVDDSNARNPQFGDFYEGEWHTVRTFDPKDSECRFSVFNDIHMRTNWYESLAAQVDSASTDFLFLNGDITSIMPSSRWETFPQGFRSCSDAATTRGAAITWNCSRTFIRTPIRPPSTTLSARGLWLSSSSMPARPVRAVPSCTVARRCTRTI